MMAEPPARVAVWAYDAPAIGLAANAVVYCAFATCLRSAPPARGVLAPLQGLATGTRFERFANHHMYYTLLYIDKYLDHLQATLVRCILERGAVCVDIPDGTGHRVCANNMSSAWGGYDPFNSTAQPPYHWPSKPGRAYAVLDYSDRVGRAEVANSGDEIQSVAAAQFLPVVSKLVDRDVGVTRSHETFIANAWWGANFKWPPPEGSHPIILAAHYSSAGKRVLEREADWFRTHYNKEVGLVGARDLGTLQALKALGIRAYFSACLTLTFNIRASAAARDRVVIVDVPDLRALPPRARNNALVLKANVDPAVKGSREARLAWAFKNLRTIGERARLVVTSRIHIALPALAQGVPVVFVTADDSALPGGTGGRTAGLTSLFHTFDMRRGGSDWNVSVTDPPPNPGNHQADRFRAAHWHYIKSHMPDADVESNARVHGVIPFQRLGRGQPLVGYPTQSLFHLVLTTNASSVTLRMLRQAEQIFYHHPDAKVVIHSRHATLEQTTYNSLKESGYDVSMVRLPERYLHDCLKNATGKVTIGGKQIAGINRRHPNWYSHESDLVRWCVMYQEGGVYLDTDVHIIKPFPLNLTNSVGYQDKWNVNGAVMVFRKGSEFARAALQWIVNNKYNPAHWVIWGPHLLTHLVNHTFRGRPDVVSALGQDAFQPFGWHEVETECFGKQWSDAAITHKLASTYAVHLNTGGARFLKTRNHLRAPAGTLCAWLFTRFCLFCGEEMISHIL